MIFFYFGFKNICTDLLVLIILKLYSTCSKKIKKYQTYFKVKIKVFKKK